MTRIRVAPPDIEEDITAEQVAAYLLRPGSGWVQVRWFGDDRVYCHERSNVHAFAIGGDVQRETIHDIARAEGRHPSAVLADIVGPARAASVGRACGPDIWGACGFRGQPWTECRAARGAGEESE